MGCINTKKESEIHPNVYRVINVDSDGVPLWSGTLEISPRELTLYRKGKEPTKWALQHLRRYGFDADLFTFEAGRRCTTGEGIYAFRCRRAESLFHLLQSYIQGIATHDDTNGLHLLDLSVGNQQNSNSQSIHQHNNNSRSSSGGGGGQQMNTSASQQSQNTNYVIPANRNSLWNSGQSVGFTRSSDTLTGDYLDPTPIRQTINYRHSTGMRLSSIGSGGSGGGVSGAPLSPGEPNSPGSPNSFNVILEVTQLNEHHQQAYQNSNLYQEFPLRSYEYNNNFLSKKLSLDIPPQEPAPAVINTVPNSSTTNTFPTSKVDSPQMISPLSDHDGDRPYVNITPGEMDSVIGTPTTAQQVNFATPRLSTSTYSFEPSSRCYENLELGGLASQPIIVPPQITRLKRFSKPEIFTKFDLPPMNSMDNSEPSTPTSASSGGGGGKDGRKVNYIVLDLDQSTTNSNSQTTTSIVTSSSSLVGSTSACDVTASSISNNNNTISNSNLNKITSPTTVTASTQQQLLLNSISANTTTTNPLNLPGTTNLLPPESPKKASLGYATIDFNKTAALSNSTAPTLDDNEGSRKTRHSLSVRQSNSISE